MEFKGTKGELHAVEYAGVIFMQDSEFYEYSESCNVLDYDHVGKIEADANGKLFACAPEMLEMLQEIYKWVETNQPGMNRDSISSLIKKATE